jgi:hypothetical protein
MVSELLYCFNFSINDKPYQMVTPKNGFAPIKAKAPMEQELFTPEARERERKTPNNSSSSPIPTR